MPHNGELPNLARIGALIDNSVHAQLIGVLMDGGERCASEPAALVKETSQSRAHSGWGLSRAGFGRSARRTLTGSIDCAAGRSHRRSKCFY